MLLSIHEGGDVAFCANPNASSYNDAVSNVASSDDRENLALRPCFRLWCRSRVHRS